MFSLACKLQKRHWLPKNGQLKNTRYFIQTIRPQVFMLKTTSIHNAQRIEASLPESDACRPALLMDAPMVRRALFEPFDPSTSSGLRTSSASWLAPRLLRPSPFRRPDWASMVLGPFAETKSPEFVEGCLGCRAESRQHRKAHWRENW